MPNLKIKYYQEVNLELKKKYKDYVGVDPDDYSYSFFSESHQIERYARMIAFWEKEKKNITPKMVGKQLIHSYIVSSAHCDIMKQIKIKFNTIIQQKILSRVEQLLDNNRNNEMK